MKPTTRTTTRWPEIEHKPTLPPGANCGSCPHLRQLHRHRRPPVLACCWRMEPARWCLARVDRLSGCPLVEDQDTTTDTDTGHQADHHTDTESLPRAGAGPSRERSDCGYFGARRNHAAKNYIFVEKRTAFCRLYATPSRPGGPAPAGIARNSGHRPEALRAGKTGTAGALTGPAAGD